MSVFKDVAEYQYCEKYRAIRCTFEGRAAEIAFPDRQAENCPWTLKTEYSWAFPDLECALLDRGFGRAYLKNINRWGLREDLDAKAAFAHALHEEFGFSEKCVPVGMSCGGLHAIKTAAYHPEIVSVLYLDAPVVNLVGYLCPSDPSYYREKTLEEILGALHLTRSELLNYRDNPLDCLPKLIANRIPAVLVWGDSDTVLRPSDHIPPVLAAYRDSGVDFLPIEVKGRDHHPHRPESLDETIAFLCSHACGCAGV